MTTAIDYQTNYAIENTRKTISQSMPDSPVLAGWSSYAQCDEDGIIRECIQRISKSTKISRTFLEVGCGNGLENNTHQLLLDGYSGVWIDGSEANIQFIESEILGRTHPCLMVQEKFVTIESAPAIALDAINFLNVESIDFLSLDIDGNDLHVCSPLITATRPKLVCVEYNATFPPPTKLAMCYNETHQWSGDDYFGATLQTWVEFFRLHGYSLIACNVSGVNAFFVQNEWATAFTNYSIEQIYQPPRYYLASKKSGHPSSLSWLRQVLSSAKEIEKSSSFSNDGTDIAAKTLRKYSQILTNTQYGNMFVYAGDDVIGASLRTVGSFQEEKISTVASFIQSTYAFNPIRFVDIGANIGTHTIYAIKSGICKIACCFEPDRNNYLLLKKNIAVNQISTLIDIHQIALSNTSSELELELSNVNFGDHRIRPATPSKVSFGEETERAVSPITAITLDAFSESHSIDWSDALLWMDTQGHEGPIFEGGKRFLSSEKSPKFIVTEFWPYGIERSGSKEQYFRFLTSCKCIFDTNLPNWQDSKGISIEELLREYEAMLGNTTKEHHPHTDLLLVVR